MSDTIFVDTAPFIYYIEKNETFFNKTDNVFDKYRSEKASFVTSVITYMEFCVGPKKNPKKKKKVIAEFELFLEILDCNICTINKEIAIRASQLKAKYNKLKSMDALQLSVAIEQKCNKFLTNDADFRNLNILEEIGMFLLD